VALASQAFRHAVKPVHLRLRRAVSTAIDRRLGIVTTDEVVAEAMGAEIGPFRLTQRALGWSGAFRLVPRLGLGSGDVVLDVGCGAGRVACVAARSSLSRVLGIDLDPRMVALAKTNAARVRGRRCPIEIVEADATRFEVPDDVTCVVIHNPFGGEALETALRLVLDSMDRRERRMRLVYGNPKEHHLVMGLGRFRPSGSLSLGWRPSREWARTQRVQFYEVARAPAPRPVAGR
jgi:SAM-dependent methyltransferase